MSKGDVFDVLVRLQPDPQGASTLDDVAKASLSLRRLLGFPLPNWLRGLGVGWAEDDVPCIQVNVSELTAEVRALIPESIDGVFVRIDAIGNIRASGLKEALRWAPQATFRKAYDQLNSFLSTWRSGGGIGTMNFIDVAGIVAVTVDQTLSDELRKLPFVAEVLENRTVTAS